MNEDNKDSINILNMFNALSKEMIASLELDKKYINHSVAKGNASEKRWIDLFRSVLPIRYKVEQAFILNRKGKVSEQIDIVIYDALNAPFAYLHNGYVLIPIECVKAVFEVKQVLNLANVKYAKKKIESVRNLTDKQVYGNQNIIGGILTLNYDWYKDLSKIKKMIGDKNLDCGCCLKRISFAKIGKEVKIEIGQEGKDKSDNSQIILASFIFRLLYLLALEDSKKEDSKRNQVTNETMDNEKLRTIEDYLQQLNISFSRSSYPLF